MAGSFYRVSVVGGIIQKTWRWAVILGLLLVAVLGFFRLRTQGSNFDWPTFLSTFARLDRSWLALGVGMALTSYYGRALRWAIFLRPLRPRAGIWNLTKATVIGFTAVVLFGRPGEIVRPYLISIKENVPLSSQLAMWLLERVIDVLFALSIFGYGLNQVQSSQAEVGGALETVFRIGGASAAAISAICLIILLFLGRYPEVFQRRLLDALSFLPRPQKTKLNGMVASFLEGTESIRDIRLLGWVVAYSVLEWALIAGCFFCVMKSFSAFFRFGLVDVFIYMGFVSFGSIVQMPGIGGGTQVVSVLVLHEIFHIPMEIASSVALINWLTSFVVIIPAGVPLALHEGLTWRSVKAIQEESAT